MTIPRGYIPGKTDFPVITSATGNISFDDDNLQTSGNITCNGLISPDIKALLAANDYQYVYDWSALPADSNFSWEKIGSGSELISNGILTNSLSGDNIYYRREYGSVNKDWKVLLQNTLSISSGTDGVIVAFIADGIRYFILKLFGTGELKYYNVSEYETIANITVTEYNKFTVFKDAQNSVYVFVNDELVRVIDHTEIYYSGTNMLGFGSIGNATMTFNSMNFKYSVLKEGTVEHNASSSKIVGGNVDVKNQTETEGVQITSDKVQSTGTNQNLELEANGTGEIVANSNFTGKAVEGAIQHKYNGSVKTAANYDIADDEGFILTSSASNVVDLDLPNAGSYLGREIIVNSANSANYTTITCDGSSNKILDTDGALYDTCTLTGGGKFVRLVATNGIYWQVTCKSDTGVTFS